MSDVASLGQTTGFPQTAGQARIQATRAFLSRFVRKPLTLLGLLIILALVLMAVFAPWLATHGPFSQDLADAFHPPRPQAQDPWHYGLTSCPLASSASSNSCG